VYASRTRKEEFSSHDENCQQNASDLEGSLVTSSGRRAGHRKGPTTEHRTAALRHKQLTAAGGPYRCCRRAMSEV